MSPLMIVPHADAAPVATAAMTLLTVKGAPTVLTVDVPAPLRGHLHPPPEAHLGAICVAEGESSMVGSTVTLLLLQSQPPNTSYSGVMVVGGMLDDVALTTEAAGLQALSLLAVDPSSSRTLLPPSRGVSRNLPPFLLRVDLVTRRSLEDQRGLRGK
jgi:hypothetical protein